MYSEGMFLGGVLRGCVLGREPWGHGGVLRRRTLRVGVSVRNELNGSYSEHEFRGGSNQSERLRYLCNN